MEIIKSTTGSKTSNKQPSSKELKLDSTIKTKGVSKTSFASSDKLFSQTAHHLAYINGPIHFTAPHSTRLYRGGVDYDEKESIHSKERYTATLAMRWATQVGGSFCVWSKDNKLNRNDVDPNYMQNEKKANSPFHQTLHAFQMGNVNKPIMHVDLHGFKSD